MILLTLPFNRRARVWIGELPQAVYEGGTVVNQVVEGTREPFGEVRRAAVEFYVPSGPRSMYGLLGAVLSPDQLHRLCVQVNTSHELGRWFADSLAGTSDDVRVGLPDEYVGGVLDGILAARQQVGNLCSGGLVFSCAAHGERSSNHLIFNHLSRIVVSILNMETDSPSEQTLAALFPLKL